MIAAIVGGGRSSSFKSSLDYVLRQDPERVGETETANLFSAPDKAHVEMEITAGAAKAIQARARMERGERPGASGSRAEKTCFHYALAWHPDDAPTSEQMFKAAHATLERLGLSQHQAVIVEHTEKPHKHVHIIASTIDPETGRANGLYRSAYVLNRWAHEYEKGQAMLRTFNRAAVFEKLEKDKADKAKPEKAEQPKVDQAKVDKAAEWKKRQDQLQLAKAKDAEAIKARHEERRKKHEAQIETVRRQGEAALAELKDRHRKETDEYWRKQGPNATHDPRPVGKFLDPHVTAGEEMGRAIKALPKRPDVPQKSEQPEPKAEPKIADRFADTSPRFSGADALKESQKQQRDSVRIQVEAALAQLRAERKIELEHEESEWRDWRSKHDRLLIEARRDMGMPYPGRPEIEAADHDAHNHDRSDGRPADREADQRAEAERDAERDKIAEEIAFAGEQPDADRYGNEIIDMTPPVAPEPTYTPSYDEPPPLEPDSYEPDRDFEIGDD